MIATIHGVASGQVPTFSITGGMITYWDLQGGSYSGSGTTLTDLDGTNNGIIVGSVPYTSGSTNYFSLDSTNSNYIRSTTNLNPYLSPANTGTSISIFTWVYPTSNGVILSEQGTTSPDSSWYDAQIEWISGVPCFGVWQYPNGIGNGPWVTSSISAGFNQWHYVGFTYNGSSLTGYVNGQPAGSRSGSRDTPYNISSVGLYHTLGYPTNTRMGSLGGSTFRVGALHVWNTGLSSSEVWRNYRATKGGYGL